MKKTNDELTKIFGGQANDTRFVNWLINTLTQMGLVVLPTPSVDLRSSMAELIKQRALSEHALSNAFTAAAVHEDLLKWVEDDPWQHQWIKKQLGIGVVALQKTGYRDQSILLIDTWGVIPKQIEVESLNRRWLLQAEQDKECDWFFTEDKETKLALLKKWKEKNPGKGVVQNFLLDGGIVDERVEVLEYFCRRPNFTDVDAYLCLDSIKKIWRQRQYREALKVKKKQQCNIVLREESINILDAMAKKYLVSRARILEVLIRFEAEQNCYLPTWIKRLGADHLDEDTTLSSSK